MQYSFVSVPKHVGVLIIFKSYTLLSVFDGVSIDYHRLV
jgi:hypothetical protein